MWLTGRASVLRVRVVENGKNEMSVEMRNPRPGRVE